MSARLGGPGGSPALVVREARHEDYQAVMDINHNVYYGLDYLPAKYHNLLRDPNSNCYLLEVNGKVVTFSNLYLVNGGEGLVAMAARTHPEYQGQGYFQKLQEESLAKTVDKHPGVKYVTFVSQDVARYKTPSGGNKRWKVKVIYPFCRHILSRQDVVDVLPLLLKHHTGLCIKPVKLGADRAGEVAKDIYFHNHVIKGAPILTEEESKPVYASEKSLKEIAHKRHSLISRSISSGHVTTFSYGLLHSVPSGLCYQLHIHGNSVDEVLIHIEQQLRHLLAIYSGEQTLCLDISLPSPSIRQIYLSVVEPVFGSALASAPEEDIVIEVPLDKMLNAKL